MHFFEYPYVIITILLIIFFVMGLIGIYFTIKSVKTSKGTAEKSFCGIGKIESDFEKAVAIRKNCCVVYISLSLDNMKRLYSEPKTNRMYEQIKRILLIHFGIADGGEISIYGKEGFVALTNFNAEEIAQRIDNSFKEINEAFANNGAVNVVHINFGYFVTGSKEVNFKTALMRAKQACSMAEDKETLSCQWDIANGKNFERKIKIENNIQNEINNNKFFIECQPILTAQTNKVIGAEVLSRLNSSTEGILSPSLFLSAVNNVGLNQQFDYYIFEKICKWISNDKENRMKYMYTINFSRYTLCDPDLVNNIIKTINKYGIKHSCIAVEILEDKNLETEELALVVKNLNLLKAKGVSILLDDFGKGYTSFNDLTQLTIDIVKIDKSITQNAITPNGFLILKNLIKTAHDLGFKTLCEGIETEEHQNAARKAGCDMLQGYYYYKPMPVTKFETLFN